MGQPKISEAEFIRLFQQLGAAGLAKHLGMAVRNVYARRKRIERDSGELLLSSQNEQTLNLFCGKYPKRLPLDIKNGIAIIGSDAHIWPGQPWVALRGMTHMVKELKPLLVCLNGDVVDGAGIGRHPPLGWEVKPDFHEELEAVDEQLTTLREASKSAKLLWILGNHDMRFEMRLAQNNHEMANLKGMRLSEHFPHWHFALSAWVNDDTVIKHRFKGGIHATHNNTLWSGKSIVTGHLHSLKVTPFDDYNGTRYGVDTGTLNNPYGAHTDYTEDNPLNHRSGFAVLTFHNGKLLMPELAAVVDEKHIQFRGKVIEV